MLSRRVNGRSRLVGSAGNGNVYEAVKQVMAWGNGIETKRPHYCYKEVEGSSGVKTPVASCRMCRVEVELGVGAAKPVPACARPVQRGRSVWTETGRVRKAREGVTELRLRNHPLDCPICDQAGECDLQDQTKRFGSDSSRGRGNKRGVEDKELGYRVRRVMTRCIHCTRCVRYTGELGILGRGNSAEIGIYSKGELTGERVGNRVERCPVGARTNRESAYNARPWELESVSTLDWAGEGEVVTRRYQGKKRVEVKPQGGRMISDKVRYSGDGLQLGRLLTSQVATSEVVLQAVESGSDRLEVYLGAGAMLVGQMTDVELKETRGDSVQRLTL